MSVFAGKDTSFPPKSFPSGRATAISTPGCDVPTAPGERILLFITVSMLPLESHIPPVAGFSSLYFMFAVLAGYVAINRLRCLDRVWMHPVFVAAYVFIGISATVELVNPLSSYEVLGKFPLMISGALLVASLCRDRTALKMLLYGYICAALWLGALLFLTSYGTLSAVTVTDFGEASKVRSEAFEDNPIKGNLNGMALTCMQGGIVALAFALGSVSVRVRNVFAPIGMFCLVASSLPMSRGVIVNAIVSCGIMLKAYGIRQGKVWLLVAFLAMGAVLLVPDVIWSRMEIMTGEGQREARVRFYDAALENVGDYLFMGVGAGNYLKKWGFEHGFARDLYGTNEYKVYMVHNAFLQVLVYWGVIGLLPFLVVIWQAYRCLPRIYSNDSLAMGMLGLAVSLLVAMYFASDFNFKGYSLGLGMLVAYQRWIKPSSVAQSANR